MAPSVPLVASLWVESMGHGMLTWPPARALGDLKSAGLSSAYVAYEEKPNVGYLWFSQPVVIPGEPTLNSPEDRTYNVHVSSGDKDWSRRMPWRAPGTAQVLGSGCGVSGGSPVQIPNGGASSDPTLYPYGMDGKDLPATKPTEWTMGSTAEVAFSLIANHGGGYSYRLCKKSENVTEDCFQKTVLQFHGNESRLHYAEALPEFYSGKPLQLPDVSIPRRIVPADKTFPKGSQWARNPIPSCRYCDQSACGGILPNVTEPVTDPSAPCDPSVGCFGGNAWWKQEQCAQQCSGFNLMRCPPGMTQFAEPAPGISGYLGDAGFLVSSAGASGIEGFSYSVVDEVEVPADLEAGEYLLSWRWDAEQSPQIWQSCADITLVPQVVV